MQQEIIQVVLSRCIWKEQRNMELRDKIAGALYGMALGDAMGMPAELWGRERARKFFGG